MSAIRPMFLRTRQQREFGGSEADASVMGDAELWQRSGFRVIEHGEPVSDEERARIEDASRPKRVGMFSDERETPELIVLYVVVLLLSAVAAHFWPWGWAQIVGVMR